MWCPIAQIVDTSFGDASGIPRTTSLRQVDPQFPAEVPRRSCTSPNTGNLPQAGTPPASTEDRHDSAPRCSSAEARADCRTTTAAAAEAAGPAANMHLRPDNEQDGGALVGTVEPTGTTSTNERPFELEPPHLLERVLPRRKRDAQAPQLEASKTVLEPQPPSCTNWLSG